MIALGFGCLGETIGIVAFDSRRNTSAILTIPRLCGKNTTAR